MKVLKKLVYCIAITIPHVKVLIIPVVNHSSPRKVQIQPTAMVL